MNDKIIKFQSYDGYDLDGSYLKAQNERGAVLFVHGIVSSRDELGFHSDYAHFLLKNGISSFRFDYRYHGNEDLALQELTLCGILNDIDAAYETLRLNSDEATKYFFIVGTSFGGGLSAYWVDFFKKNEINKLILNAPVIDYEDDVLGRNQLVENGRIIRKASKQLNESKYVISSDIEFGRGLINEVRFINGIKPLINLGERVSIFHGDIDEDVPLSSSQKFKVEGTDLRIIEGVGHGFGIEIDDDLTHPETKKVHAKIYQAALNIIDSCYA